VVTSAGVAPPLVQLAQLNVPDVPADVKKAAVWALQALSVSGNAQNSAAVSATATIAALAQLLGPDTSADIQVAATRALRHLASSIPPAETN
jgi:hypothetical protein